MLNDALPAAERPKSPGTRLRIGVLSDLHCELEPSGARWINEFEPEQLDLRMDAALGWFSESRVDLILLLGDTTHESGSELAHVFCRLAAAKVAPLATVNGNHDLQLGDLFGDCAHEHGIRLLYDEPLELAGVPLTGIAAARGVAPPEFVGRVGGLRDDGLLVVASHFPVLSEAARVAGAGLPYSGDLVNRAEVEAELRADPGRKLVLAGHIHARCSAGEGQLLQFTVGAMIEPPFDATLVEIDAAALSVRRTARRLGEIGAPDPVFAPDEEQWQYTDGAWEVETRAAA